MIGLNILKTDDPFKFSFSYLPAFWPKEKKKKKQEENDHSDFVTLFQDFKWKPAFWSEIKTLPKEKGLQF